MYIVWNSRCFQLALCLITGVCTCHMYNIPELYIPNQYLLLNKPHAYRLYYIPELYIPNQYLLLNKPHILALFTTVRQLHTCKIFTYADTILYIRHVASWKHQRCTTQCMYELHKSLMILLHANLRHECKEVHSSVFTH